jgi:sensor histidine kinase YesM
MEVPAQRRGGTERGSGGREWVTAIRWSDVAWLLAINVVANVVIAATFRDYGDGPAWIAIVAGAWPGLVISTTISGLCLLVMPGLARAVHGAFGRWVRWVILTTALIALAVLGSAVAVALLTLLGRVEGWHVFVPTLLDTLKVAILITLVFGTYSTINETLRGQLDRTLLALRTKERDEAEARRLASEAQLASLESRVNPHFFFNTLNSIAALTREDAARAEKMTTQLASLMRSALNADETPLVALEQEAQSVRDYLEIEHVRFGERLRYDIEIAEEARTALVPRLAVQTVVENSVKYAVSPQREGATIRVSAERHDGRVHLQVVDDGPGFDVSTVTDGHGLALLRARLTLLYNGDASLSIDSRAGQTTVAMDLPVSPDAA